MKRTLGLDLGTNSIGWAIITEEDGKKRITAEDSKKAKGHNPVLAGSVIFSAGVASVKGNEVPSVSARTSARRTRRLYMRRRMRKQRLLERLIKNGLCPLSEAGRRAWQDKGQYPKENAFIAWFKMNPYELRAKGLDEKLSPHELGRVLYHIAQRRGFRSNRKGGDGEQKTLHEGSPEKGIRGYDETKALIAKHGTLGRAGAELHQTHTPIRNRYVMRSDLVDEFNQLWEVQKNFHPFLTDALKTELGDGKNGDLFFQRPLKGKKGDVGRCTLEPGNKRAPISSPMAEVFNVLHAVNNIKVRNAKGDMENLGEAGRNAVLPCFFWKSKSTFPIDDVRKALKKAGIEGELNYEKWESRAAKENKEVKLTGAMTIANLADLWNVDALEIVRAYGAMREEDAPERAKWDHRWNVIHNEQNAWDEIGERKRKGQYVRTPDSKHEQRDLKEYAATVWGFDEENLKALKGFNPKQGYHNLSTRAIGRILPHLYQGIPYHNAVLFANLPAVFKEVHWRTDAKGEPVCNDKGQPLPILVKNAKGKDVPKVDDRWAAMSEEERERIRQGIRDQIAGQRRYNMETILLNGLIRNYRDQFGDEGGRRGFWNATWNQRLDATLTEAFSNAQRRELGDDGLKQLRERIQSAFLHHIENHQKVLFEKVLSMEERIKFWLVDTLPEYELAKTIDKRRLKRRVDQLYHHSAISTYRERDDRLGSPLTRGMKNPMVYRALHTLRKLVNDMIKAGLIDKRTTVHIEMARQLDSANKRRAWERYQAVMRKKNEEAEAKVKEYFKKETASDDEIERMWLFEEARYLFKEPKCVYTGRIIGVADLFNGSIEVDHTWPRSKTADNSMANKMLCDKRYNADLKKGRWPWTLDNFDKPARVLGVDCPALSDSTKRIYAEWKSYEREVEALRNKSKAASTKDQKDKAIQDRWFAQFFRDYWRTKHEHLMADEIKPRFLNKQLVATAQITKLARAYMNSYFERVTCYKPEALSAFRKEWLGESFVKEKDRSKHSHHAVDAAVCAAVDLTVFNALAHHYEEHDEKNVAASFDHPWTSFGTDMRDLRNGALIYHVDKQSIGRSSSFKKKVKLKNGKVVEVTATGDTVRGSLHNDTFYGRIKRNVKGTDDYETVTVIRKSLLGVTQFPFKDADKANVVDKRIKELLASENLEDIKKAGGLDVKVKNGDGFTVQKIKKVRVFEKRIQNPVAIKMHRDTIRTSKRHKYHEVLEHKHFLWVTGGENPVMGVYANEKGKLNGYLFSLQELMRYIQERNGRNELLASMPRQHPDPKRTGYNLAERDGKPFILHAGQKLVLFQQNPEEIDREDHSEMNKRTYVIRQFMEDGRIRMHNVLDGRDDEVIKQETLTEWDPARPLMQLRISISKLNALCDGIDINLSPLPKVI